MDANEGAGGCPFECLTRSYQAWCGGLGGSEDSDAVQCSAVQCSAVQCSAVQCSAVQVWQVLVLA